VCRDDEIADARERHQRRHWHVQLEFPLVIVSTACHPSRRSREVLAPARSALDISII
jgi:hypothetical protein